MNLLPTGETACSHTAPILYDHAYPYCILATKHPRMEQCCSEVAGSPAQLLEDCYPWCSIINKPDANDTAEDTINKFFMCLIDGGDENNNNGTSLEGMSCSTMMQKRDIYSGACGRTPDTGWSLRIKATAGGLGVLMMVALLYG